MTPEFIGKMVYSSITYSNTPARQHGLMCFGHYILHTESDSQSLIHIYSGLTPTQTPGVAHRPKSTCTYTMVHACDIRWSIRVITHYTSTATLSITEELSLNWCLILRFMHILIGKWSLTLPSSSGTILQLFTDEMSYSVLII